MTKRKAVLFDLDGTLCNVESIRFMVDPRDPQFSGGKDFDRFHRESVSCPPHQRVVSAFHAAEAEGFTCIAVTARKEKYRTLTRWWLALNGMEPRHQVHRADHDSRPDVEVKRDILANLRTKYDVVEAWDDNPSIIELWRDEGLLVNVVPGWPERGDL